LRITTNNLRKAEKNSSNFEILTECWNGLEKTRKYLDSPLILFKQLESHLAVAPESHCQGLADHSFILLGNFPVCSSGVKFVDANPQNVRHGFINLVLKVLEHSDDNLHNNNSVLVEA
jgi:hypothetical protein